jgi:hypothetical protein
MLWEGLCDAPRLGMQLYMLVQTCGGSFVVSFAVNTQFIAKTYYYYYYYYYNMHMNGICLSYTMAFFDTL